MWWIMLKIMSEIGIIIWKENKIYVERNEINGKLVNEKKICEGYGIWECVKKRKERIIEKINVEIRKLIKKGWEIRNKIKVFFNVVLNCWKLKK
jgi:hypothetical protein